MKLTPKVSVCMITYNHEKYIAQAIESILIQKTTFDFELIIADDCSTDSTRSIVLDYKFKFPNQIRLILPEKNIGMMNNFIQTLKSCEGEFTAICEGDDYWIDPYKLQKQVNFLEANSAASICWTRYSVLSPDGYLNAKPEEDPYFIDGAAHNVNLENLFNPYLTLTLTTLFKKHVLDDINFLQFKYYKDNTLYAHALSKGEGYIIDDYTAVYRKHGNGVWSSVGLVKQTIQDYYNFKEIYNQIPAAKTKHIKEAIFKKASAIYSNVYIDLDSYDRSLFYSLTQQMLIHAPISGKARALKWMVGSFLRQWRIILL